MDVASLSSGELERLLDLAEREARSRAVLDAACEAMVLVSATSYIQLVNRPFLDLFRFPADGLVGRHLDDLWPQMKRTLVNPDRFRTFLWEAMSSQEGELRESVVQSGFAHREVEVSSLPVPTEQGEYLGRLFRFRDLSQDGAVERRTSEFVSLVSHELRTPLTSIKGFVDLLLEGEAGELEGEQRQFLQIVKNSSDRLAVLINDLLDLSRIEAGKVELRRVPVTLEGLIRGVAAAFRLQIDARNQQLCLDVPKGLPAVVADPDRVTQILTNLVSNAHKYTPEGGSVTIGAQAQGEMVRVDVQDTGVGMSAEELAQVFQKFFRGRSRLAQEVGGTGLGLAITRSLVELHGGQIEVSSAVGRGTTFRFTLPATSDMAELTEY